MHIYLDGEGESSVKQGFGNGGNDVKWDGRWSAPGPVQVDEGENYDPHIGYDVEKLQHKLSRFTSIGGEGTR